MPSCDFAVRKGKIDLAIWPIRTLCYLRTVSAVRRTYLEVNMDERKVNLKSNTEWFCQAKRSSSRKFVVR